MVAPNEVYSNYLRHGGLTGICEEIIMFLETKWEDHDFIKNLFKKCVEIYQKAFPRGHPPRNPSEAIRRISIFAAHLGRLRRLRSPRLKEFEKLYYEYRDCAHRMMYYRDAWSFIRRYNYYYRYILDIIKAAKIEMNEYKKAELYFEAIRSFYDRTNWLLNLLKNRFPNAYEVWKFLADRFNLGTLWLEFKYALTLETKDDYWTYRMLEIHIQTWTHAELLFAEITDKRLSEVTEDILDITDNSWLLEFDELKSIPFEYESKQLLDYMQGTLPKNVRFKFELFDHNYNFERVKAWGQLPYNWQKLASKEIIDWILKTGDIVYYEVRGIRGRLRKGISYIRKRVTIHGTEILSIEKVLYQGVERDIRDFLKPHSVKKEMTKKK